MEEMCDDDDVFVVERCEMLLACGWECLEYEERQACGEERLVDVEILRRGVCAKASCRWGREKGVDDWRRG